MLANPRCQGDASTKLLIISTTAMCFLSQQYSFVQNGSMIAESSLALPSLQAQVQLEQLYLSRSTVCCPLDLSVKRPIHGCMRLFMWSRSDPSETVPPEGQPVFLFHRLMWMRRVQNYGWPIFQSNHDLLSLEYYCWFDTAHSFHAQLFHFTLHFQLLYC